MLLKNLLLGVEKMEILKKILEIISQFLEQRKESKVEKEEIERIEIEQKETINKNLKARKKESIKQPKKDDFFNDDSW